MENPDGAGFLGHSNSVLWILIPDSNTITALSSGLKDYKEEVW